MRQSISTKVAGLLACLASGIATAHAAPAAAPTGTPTAAPTGTFTAAPTTTPATAPTATPVAAPTATPAAAPPGTPEAAPSATPASAPTATPTATPAPHDALPSHAPELEPGKALHRMKAVRYRHPTPGSRVDTGGAYVMIRAPLDIVRKVVQRHDRYDRILPRIEQSRIMARRNGATDLYLRAPVLYGAVTLWALLRFLPPRKQGVMEVIDGQYLEGNLEVWRGTWKLLPCGPEHTLLTVEIFADLKIPLPASVITPELEWVSDKAVSAVRDRAECAYRARRAGRQP